MRTTIASILLFSLLLSPSLAASQDFCAEPASDDYFELMGQVRVAIDAGDFEQVLNLLSTAREQWSFAPIDFSMARAYHHLERWEEAQNAYNTFLHRFEECPDPTGLADRARAYLVVAIEEQARNMSAFPANSREQNGDDVADVNGDDGNGDDTGEDSSDGRPVESEGSNAGWYVIGAGAACLAGGVVYDVINLGLLDERQQAVDTLDHTAYTSANDDIQTARIIEGALFGTGVVAVSVGVILLLVSDDSYEPESQPVSVVPMPSGAAISVDLPF